MRDAETIDGRLARRLAALRGERQWSLDELATRSGISRATLSRVENGETSPTATLLGKLAAAFGMTVSRLMLEAEGHAPDLLPAAAQTLWTDPETGFRRRAVSPPTRGFRVEVVEGQLPAGRAIAYERAPQPGLEHHVVMLSGRLELEVEGARHRLAAGDCLRFRLSGASRYAALGPGAARYLVVIAT